MIRPAYQRNGPSGNGGGRFGGPHGMGGNAYGNESSALGGGMMGARRAHLRYEAIATSTILCCRLNSS